MATTMFLALLSFYIALGVSGLKLEKCPAGFYCPKSMLRLKTASDGYLTPLPCPRGTISGAGAVQCTNCTEGEYTWDEGSTFCERCESGYMCPAIDADPEPCPLGTYSPGPVQTCCKVCNSGSYTPRLASTSCTRCRPGQYCPVNDIRLSCANGAGTTTTTVSTSTRQQTNPCSSSGRCLNGGICQPVGATGFTCICTANYYGVRCERNDETTITEVFTRNNWTDVLAVIDVTSSMSPCASAVGQWMALAHQGKTSIKAYVFFNDGDAKDDEDKVIGSTGGIYMTNSTDLSVVRALMEKAMRMGYGGDGPENDVEALLYGIARCPTCRNFVHIADNKVTPRDMGLLSGIKVPIKVVPCQVETSTGVNPALIDIADKTGGSLHTTEQDFINLSGIAVGEIISIGDHTYRRTSTGFIRI